MSLQTRLNAFIAAVGADVKALNTGKAATSHTHSLADAAITGILPDSKLSGAVHVNKGFVSTATDFNTFTSPGAWKIIGAAAWTNFPPGAYQWGQLVVTEGDNSLTQVYYPDTTGSGAAPWVRHFYGSTWRAWVQLSETTHGHPFSAISGTIAAGQLPARLGPGHSNDVPGNDWNNAVEAGDYASDTAANDPGAGWWLGKVEAHTDRWVTQTLHAFTADGPSDTQLWRRDSWDNGAGRSWSAWYRLRWSETELDLRYSRLLGEAVLWPTTTASASSTSTVNWISIADMVATFVAPPSGKVEVEVAARSQRAGTSSNMGWRVLLDGTAPSQMSGQGVEVVGSADASGAYSRSRRVLWPFDGLTPGQSYTYQLQMRYHNISWGGVYGPLVMQVRSR